MSEIPTKKHFALHQAKMGPFAALGETEDAARAELIKNISVMPDDNEPVVRVDYRDAPWVMWHNYVQWVYRCPAGELYVIPEDIIDRDAATEEMLKAIHAYNEGQ